MNKFEQLIEYVINDEEAKARELFHDIVVEKSRQIYEEMMQEEEHEDEDEKVDESADEDIDESIDEAMGGDQADDLIDDIEVEEQGIGEAEDDDEDMGDDHHADVGGEEELEDRVVDLEDKLDELMAEFEALMGDDAAADMDDMDADIDDMDVDVDMDSEEVVDDEFETEGMMEAVNLKAAPKPVTSEEGGINKKSTVAANAGAKGPVGNTVKPVSTGSDMGGHHDAAAYKNTTKELIGRVGNTPAQSTQTPKAAPKPHLAQATGVNTKSVLKKV